MSSDETERQRRMLQLLAMLGDLDIEAAKASSSHTEVKTHRSTQTPYMLVAAIDFGTTFSGYAFSFKTEKHKPDEIKMNKNWGLNLGFQSYKTPTCVLLDSNKELDSFGYEAQQKYADMYEDEAKKYYYFEKFKMKLYETKDLGKSTEISATNGCPMRALDIFSMSLAFMKKHLMGVLSQSGSREVDANLIRWVITVPAIWSDASKQFMREASLMAGLIDKPDSPQLLIALEPEAASLFVRKLEINQFVKPTHSKGGYQLKEGAKYLVIDAGGGTLDVTAHELQTDGKVKELHNATGGASGGTRVDEMFVQLMENIFDKQFIDKYKREHAEGWLLLANEFEKKKRIPNPAINVNISFAFATQYQQDTGKTIDQVVKEYGGTDVKFSNGMICISGEKTKALFQPVIQDIVDHIETLLQLPRLQGIDYLFCVGGFSECILFQEAIKSKFSKQGIVLIPEEASLAVVKGAVQFGHNPDSVSSRIAAKSYGVETMSYFVPFIHKRPKAISLEGKLYCKDLLETYVKKDDEVPLDYTKTTNFTPVTSHQDAADIEIYCADRSDVMYIDDEGVDYHGKIQVKWPGSGLERKLEIRMIFGGTEVKVEATSYPGENKEETTLNFLTD